MGHPKSVRPMLRRRRFLNSTPANSRPQLQLQPLVCPDHGLSCGSLVRNRQLVIPYAMSDYATTFATVPLGEVLEAME